MTTVIEDKTRKSGRQEPILTNHFNERYYERVLDKAPVGKIISQKNKALRNTQVSSSGRKIIEFSRMI